MEDIRTLENAVVGLLREYPETRNSDVVLYLELMKILNSSAKTMSFEYVMLHREELGLPQFESVGRARRKAQEMYSELQAVNRVRTCRRIKAREFEDYARDKNAR